MVFAKNTGWLAVVAVGAATFGLVCAAPAAPADPAATEAAAKTGTLDEIIVTATRRKQTLQDVPMSVDVATGEQLQKLNILDVKDVDQLAPGLQLTNTTGRTNSATLRGVQFDPDSGASPAVDIYLNDIPIDAQTAFTAMYDLDQINVLRGPQGALRGRTAPAGAITLTTRRPDLQELSGYAMTSATDRGGFNVQGALSIPLIPGKLAVRVAGLDDGNRINDVRDVNRGGEFSGSHTHSARVSVAWDPTDNFTLNLMYQYLHSNNLQYQQVMGPGNAPAAVPFGDPTRSGPPASVGDYIAVSDGEQRFINNSNFINLSFDWNLGPVTMSFNGARQYTVLTQTRDIDFGNAIPGYQNTASGPIPYPISTAELRLLSNNEGFWNWTLGAFYTVETGDVTGPGHADTFFFTAPYAAGLYLPINTSLDVPIYSRSTALSASSRFKMTDALTLEVAARFSKIKVRQTAQIDITSPGFPGGFGIPAIPGFAFSESLVPDNLADTKENPVTGGATLTYKVTPSTTAYTAYGRSFRAPTSGVGLQANITPDLLKTQNETSDSIEFGVKTALFNQYSLNADIFYQKFKNYLARFNNIPYNCGALYFTTNNCAGAGPPSAAVDGVSSYNYGGDATVKGLETTIAGRPTTNWDFSVSASYIRARYSNARLPCTTFNAAGDPFIAGGGNVSFCSTSDRLAPVPDFSLTGNSEVRFPVGTLTPFARMLINYKPSVAYTLDNYDYPSFTLLNLFLGVRGGDKTQWEVSLFAKNVLDQRKITHISPGNFTFQTASGTPYDSGYRLVNVTNPREIGLTANVNF